MFCFTLTKKRQYYDSECLKRARSSKILAIDASYKVPKWMMKWGGQRIYETLHSGTNEYNEIVLQRFSTSDNHDELGSNLESLGKIGLNPYLCFSDDPGRDESLLKRIFLNLKTKGDEDEEMDSDLDDIDDLKEFDGSKEILYLCKYENATAALSRFREDLDEAIKAKPENGVVVALDTEWPVYFDGGPHHKKKLMVT